MIDIKEYNKAKKEMYRVLEFIYFNASENREIMCKAIHIMMDFAEQAYIERMKKKKRTKMKLSKKYIKASQAYEYFANNIGVKKGENDLESQYLAESQGMLKAKEIYLDYNPETNFYAVGKRWKEWHITEWMKDLDKKNLFLFSANELYEYYEGTFMIEILNSAIYPQLSEFQKDMVDSRFKIEIKG